MKKNYLLNSSVGEFAAKVLEVFGRYNLGVLRSRRWHFSG